MNNGQKRVGRPPGPGKSMGERIAVAADRKLIEWLKLGAPTWTGQLDPNGGPVIVYKPLSANHMNMVLKRLAQIDAGIFGSGRAARSLVDAARARGIGSGGMRFGGPAGDDNDA